MAKLNKATASKRASQASQYSNGTVIGDRYISQYDQGYACYFARQKYSKCWHPHKQQGWRCARDSDMKLLTQMKTRNGEGNAATEARLYAMLGIAA